MGSEDSTVSCSLHLDSCGLLVWSLSSAERGFFHEMWEPRLPVGIRISMENPVGITLECCSNSFASKNRELINHIILLVWGEMEATSCFFFFRFPSSSMLGSEPGQAECDMPLLPNGLWCSIDVGYIWKVR